MAANESFRIVSEYESLDDVDWSTFADGDSPRLNVASGKFEGVQAVLAAGGTFVGPVVFDFGATGPLGGTTELIFRDTPLADSTKSLVQFGEPLVSASADGTLIGGTLPQSYGGSIFDFWQAGTPDTRRFHVTRRGRVGIGGPNMEAGIGALCQLYARGGVGTLPSDPQMANLCLETQHASTYSLIIIQDATSVNNGNNVGMGLNPAGAAGTHNYNIPLTGRLSAGYLTSGGLHLQTWHATAPIVFSAGGNTLGHRRWQVAPSGHFLPFGTAYTLGNATDYPAVVHAGSYAIQGTSFLRSPGSYNVLLGEEAGNAITGTGSSIIAIGYQAGYSLPSAAGATATYIGLGAGYSDVNGYNVYLGAHTGRNNATGYFNSGLGYASLQCAPGSSANQCVGIGRATGAALTSGSANILIGNSAGEQATTAHYLTLLGHAAGQYFTTGGNNTCLGGGAGPASGNGAIVNAIALGYGARLTADRQWVVGEHSNVGGILDAYFGQGVQCVSPSGFTLHATGGSGPNNPGGDLIFAASQGTGTGLGGKIRFQIAPPGVAGSALNPLVDVLTLDSAGFVLPGGSIGGPLIFDLGAVGLPDGDTELIFADKPAASATKSLIQFNGPLVSGSVNGTYLGGVLDPTFTGSLIDVWGGATPERKFQVTHDGRIGIGGPDMLSGLGAVCAIYAKAPASGNPHIFLESQNSTAGPIIQFATVGQPTQYFYMGMSPAGANNSNLSTVPLATRIVAGSGMTGGLLIGNQGSNPIIFFVGSSAFTSRRWQIDATGNFLPFGSTYNIGSVTDRVATFYGTTLDLTGGATLGSLTLSGHLSGTSFAFVHGGVECNFASSSGFRVSTQGANCWANFGSAGGYSVGFYGTSNNLLWKVGAQAGVAEIISNVAMVGGAVGFTFDTVNELTAGARLFSWKNQGVLKLGVMPNGALQNYAQRVSDGYTEITSSGSGQHSGYLHCRSEFDQYGMYYDASRAANIAAATGFYYGAHVFGIGFTATTGNILQVYNNTEYRFNIAARGGTTIRNDQPSTGNILTLQAGDGTTRAYVAADGTYTTTSGIFRSEYGAGSWLSWYTNRVVGVDPGGVYLGGVDSPTDIMFRAQGVYQGHWVANSLRLGSNTNLGWVGLASAFNNAPDIWLARSAFRKLRVASEGDTILEVDGSSSGKWGLRCTYDGVTRAGFDVDAGTGEIRIGALSTGGYYPAFYNNNMRAGQFSGAYNLFQVFGNRSNDGYVGIGTSGSAVFGPYIVGRSESTDTGLYFGADRAGNQPGLTGFYNGAFNFVNAFTATTGNLFQVWNNTEWRLGILARGTMTFRNDPTNAGHILTLQEGGGSPRAYVAADGTIATLTGTFRSDSPSTCWLSHNGQRIMGSDGTNVFLGNEVAAGSSIFFRAMGVYQGHWTTGSLKLGSATNLAWSSTADAYASAADITLARSAAATLRLARVGGGAGPILEAEGGGTGIWGYQISYAGTTRGYFDANSGSGEVRIGGGYGGYYPSFYAHGAQVGYFDISGNFKANGVLGVGVTPDTLYAGFFTATIARLRLSSATATNHAYLEIGNSAFTHRLIVGRENSAGASLATGGSPYAGVMMTIDADPIHLAPGGYATLTAFPAAFSPGRVLVGDGAVDAAAALQVNSTTRGFLPPRMTTTQRDAISTPPDGLVLYNATANEFQGRAASTWVSFGAGGGGGSAHDIQGAQHTASGLTVGHVLTATSATAFSFQAPTGGGGGLPLTGGTMTGAILTSNASDLGDATTGRFGFIYGKHLNILENAAGQDSATIVNINANSWGMYLSTGGLNSSRAVLLAEYNNATGAWGAGTRAFGVWDDGTTRFGSTDKGLFNPDVADGATAIAYLFDTKNVLTSTAKIASFKNQGTEKLYVDRDGVINSDGTLARTHFDFKTSALSVFKAETMSGLVGTLTVGYTQGVLRTTNGQGNITVLTDGYNTAGLVADGALRIKNVSTAYGYGSATDYIFDSNRGSHRIIGGAATNAAWYANRFGVVTVSGHSAAQVVTDVATVRIDGAPVAGSLATLTNVWSFWVGAGNSRLGGGLLLGDGPLNAAAALQIDSTTKGFLPPRMTTVQRDAISSPPDGLVLYNATANEFQGRAASTWVSFGASGGGGGAHDIAGVLHTASGLTVGHVLTATSATSFAFQAPAGGGPAFSSAVPDGATAVAFSFDTVANYVTEGGKLVSWRDQGIERAYLDYDGALYAPGGTFTGAVAAGSLAIGSLSGLLRATAGVVSGGATTTHLPEGTNLYFTDARAVAAVGGMAHAQAHALTGADHTVSGLTPGQVLTALTAGTFGWQALPGNPQVHALTGAEHTVSGLTAGQVLTALTPTTFGWQALPGGSLLLTGGVMTGAILTSNSSNLGDTTTGRWGTLYAGAGDFTGQVRIGAGTLDAAAQLQVDSTTRGFLPPRLTGAQRDAISSPPDGLILYNATTSEFQGRAGGAWVSFGAGGGGAAHALIGALHTASGLTEGHVLRATGPTSFAFQALGGTGTPGEFISLQLGSTSATNLVPDVVNGSAAVAYTFDTLNPITTTTAKLLSLKNAGVEKAYFNRDGHLFLKGPYGSTGQFQISPTDNSGAGLYLNGSGGSVNVQLIMHTSLAQWFQYTGGTTAGDMFWYSGADRMSISPTSRWKLRQSTTIYTDFNPQVVDGAAAIAYTFDTQNALNNATAKIASFKSAGVERFSISAAGSFSGDGLLVRDRAGVQTYQLYAQSGVLYFDLNANYPLSLYRNQSTGLTHTGIGISSPAGFNAAALLQLDSTSRGLLPPRMTTTERNAIASPPDGLLLYNATAGKLQGRHAGVWEDLGGGGGGGGPVSSFLMLDSAAQQWQVSISPAGTLLSTPLYVTAPTQVLNLNPIPASTTVMNLTWDYRPGADTYSLEHSLNGTAWETPFVVADPGYTHGGLLPGTRYYYRVRATNTHGTGPYSATVYGYTYPLAVGTVTVTPVLATQINLSWAAISPAPASYRVERSPNGTSGWTEIAAPTTNSYSDLGVSENTTYYYRVKARTPVDVENVYRDGAYSPVASGTTPAGPAQVTGLTATPASTAVINLAWSTVPGALSYDLEWSANGTSWTFLGNTGLAVYPHSALTAGTRYYYRVRAVNASGGGAYSTTVNTYTFPAAVGTVTVTVASGTQLNLSWAALLPAPVTYRVERSLDGSTGWTEVGAPTTNFYNNTGLTVGTTYYYRVKARNPGGDGAYSAVASGATP